MGRDPFPNVVENREGDRLTVYSMREQDAATKQGYFRRIARDREFYERQAEKKDDA